MYCLDVIISLSVCVYTYFHLYIFWTRNKTVHILSSTFFLLFYASSFFSLSKWFTGIRLLCVHMHFSSCSKICRKLNVYCSNYYIPHYVYSIFNLYTWSFPLWLKIWFDFLRWTWSDRSWEKMFKNPNIASYISMVGQIGNENFVWKGTHLGNNIDMDSTIMNGTQARMLNDFFAKFFDQ